MTRSGVAAWVCSFAITGYLFSGELERVAASAAFLGKWLVVLLLAAFTGYIFRKFYNRQKFLRKLKIARITPEELKEKIDAGEDISSGRTHVTLAGLRSKSGDDSWRAAHRCRGIREEVYEVIPRDG